MRPAGTGTFVGGALITEDCTVLASVGKVLAHVAIYAVQALAENKHCSGVRVRAVKWLGVNSVAK